MTASDDSLQQELKKRLRDCTEALASDTKNPVILEEMGEILEALDRDGEALKYYMNSARCFLRAGLPRDALRTCRHALELSPQLKEALELMEDLEKQGDVRKLRTTVRRSSLPETSFSTEGASASRRTDSARDAREIEQEFAGEDLEKTPGPNAGGRGFDWEVGHVTVEIDDGDVLEADPLPSEDEWDGFRSGWGHEGPGTEEAGRPPEARSGHTEEPPADRDIFQALIPLFSPSIDDKPAPIPGEPVIELRSPARHGDEPTSKETEAHPSEESRSPTRTPQRQPLALPASFRNQGQIKRVSGGEYIVKEYAQSTHLYLLTRGTVEVLKETWAHQPGRNRLQRLAVLEAESCIGELALLGDGFRHATVRALEPCELRAFGKAQVKDLMREDPEVSRAIRMLFRQRLQDTLIKFSPIFKRLSEEKVQAILSLCKPRRLEADQVVARQGARSTGIHFVLLGMLDVIGTRPGESEPVLLSRLSDGDVFGVISMMRDRPSPATVRTRTFVQLLYLSLKDCERLMAEEPEIQKELEAEAQRRELSYRSILEGVAQFERGTTVFLLEKKKKEERGGEGWSLDQSLDQDQAFGPAEASSEPKDASDDDPL